MHRRGGFQAGFGTHPFMRQQQQGGGGGGAAAAANPLQGLLHMLPIVLLLLFVFWSGSSDPVRPSLLTLIARPTLDPEPCSAVSMTTV